jgi:hypothetical protein
VAYKHRHKKKKFGKHGIVGPLHMTKGGRHGKKGLRKITKAETERDMG